MQHSGKRHGSGQRQEGNSTPRPERRDTQKDMLMANRFGPMVGGLEIDIETGEPVAIAQLDRQARRQEARNRALARHDRLLQDLAGSEGAVLQQIAAKLVLRVDQLIENDAEARTYRDILRGIQNDLRVGQRIIDEEMAQIYQGDAE